MIDFVEKHEKNNKETLFMNKKLGKLVAVTMSAVMLLGVSACGDNPSGSGDGGTISISLWDTGWGSDWLYAMKDAFTKKYPEYTVEISASVSDGDITNDMPNPDEHEFDIFMGCNNDLELYSSYYELLDDVVAGVNDGESKTVGEKIGTEYLSMMQTAEGHYDKLSYGTGYYTIMYKGDIFEKYGYEVPNTTDELVALVNTMKTEDDVVPFIHFTNGGYWHSMLWTWAIQYAGSKDFYDMSKNPTLAALTDDNNGIPQGLSVLDSLIRDVNNYYTGSSGMTFSIAQSTYLAEAEALNGVEIAMMVNGAWLENEVKSSESKLNETVKAMKTPVVSSIIERCPTINDDETLSAVIDAIDSGKTSYSGVSEADFERIATARKVEVTNAPALEICIPNYSDNIEGAKKFVKYFYSDEALQIWYNCTHVRQFANFDNASLTYDTAGLSTFAKSQLELMNHSAPVAEGRPHSSHSIFSLGGASLVAGYDNGGYAAAMVNQPPETYKDIWNNIKTNFNRNWNTYWSNAGLSVPEE